MSPEIEFTVDDVPPIKRGAESMWGKQLSRIRSLRRQAARAAAGMTPARRLVRCSLWTKSSSDGAC